MYKIVREASFANRLREARLKTGMKQTKIADIIGLSRQNYNNWEKGYCKPRGKRMRQLAKAVKCDATWLQHGEGSEAVEHIEVVTTMLRVLVRELSRLNKALKIQEKRAY